MCIFSYKLFYISILVYSKVISVNRVIIGNSYDKYDKI